MSEEPISIPLNYSNCLGIMFKYIELIQQKGVFSLEEAHLLKRAWDVLVNNVTDKDPNLTKTTSLNLFIQGVVKGQSNGCFTLNDAFIVYNVVKFLNDIRNDNRNEIEYENGQAPNLKVSPPPISLECEETRGDEGEGDSDGEDFDLSELSKPVPFNITNV